MKGDGLGEVASSRVFSVMGTWRMAAPRNWVSHWAVQVVRMKRLAPVKYIYDWLVSSCFCAGKSCKFMGYLELIGKDFVCVFFFRLF